LERYPAPAKASIDSFENKNRPRLRWKLGLALLIPSVPVHLPFYHSGDDAIGTVGLILITIQLAVLLASIVLTEKALKRIFHDDGSRR